MKFSFKDDDLDNGSTMLGEGEHVVSICDVEQTKSQKGNDMAIVSFKDKHGRGYMEYYVDSMPWKIGQLAIAAGIPKGTLLNAGLDPELLMGKKVSVLREKDGEYTNSKGNTYPNYSNTYHALDSVETMDEIPF